MAPGVLSPGDYADNGTAVLLSNVTTCGGYGKDDDEFGALLYICTVIG